MLQQSTPNSGGSSLEPSMYRHRPASEETQDISHLLACIFKELYTADVIGKDVLANLEKSKGGEDTYLMNYVEELKKIHSEYKRRTGEADMLEQHIIQARARAAADEERELQRRKDEAGDMYELLSLPLAESTFRWCVNSKLLRKHNLICPDDYISNPPLPIKAPTAESPEDYRRSTFNVRMHASKSPQDESDTGIHSPGKTMDSLLAESESSYTLPPTPESSEKLKRASIQKMEKTAPKKPSWYRSRIQEEEELAKYEEKKNFLKNPRSLPPNVQGGGKSLIIPKKKVEKMVSGRRVILEESDPQEPIPVFLANPPILLFTDYKVGQIYETNLELRNLTSASRHVRVIPPCTQYFSIGLGKFPGEGGMVAPGMSCQYTIRFIPDCLADFEDFILIETQAPFPLVVPIEARRPPPILTLPRVLDCGHCLVGGVKFTDFLCRNEGLSPGRFCIMSKKQWPAANFRSVATPGFVEKPPFALGPFFFELLPGEATLLEVAFLPPSPEAFSEVFTIVCDNCQVKEITVTGSGELVALQLISITGGEDSPYPEEITDLSANHFVRFEPLNPHSIARKTVVIHNATHLELPFCWRIVKPNLKPVMPNEVLDLANLEYTLATETAFDVSPNLGALAPHQDNEFTLSFCPLELQDYHVVCHLVLRDIPESVKEGNGCNAEKQGRQTAPTEKSSSINDVVVMEIEVKGPTEPFKVLLEPYAILIPGESFVCTTLKKHFKMWNNSRSFITFHWDRICDCHILEVQPPTGVIEANECCDLELAITGGKPGKSTFSLQCHIENDPDPVVLHVEAAFKGPQVCTDCPSVEFGLMRLGESALSTITIYNVSQLVANWSMKESPAEGREDFCDKVKISPSSGTLPPLGSCNVAVFFQPKCCQHFETVLELEVEQGTGFHLAIQGDVQMPQVCLQTCELVFSELYVGVPAQGSVKLFNQTLLPATYTWGELEGQQSHYCSAVVHNPNGTLGPNEEREITVEFLTYTEEELTDIALVCSVNGMEKPLVLGIYAKASGLRVSYSILSSSSLSQSTSESNNKEEILEFGEVSFNTPVKRQLVITNLTAISAAFLVEAEYFSGRPPSTLIQSAGASRTGLHNTIIRKPVSSSVANKMEKKAHQEFVAALLSHGRGATFFVHPYTGTIGPFQKQTIDIVPFANMWGDYQDMLICKVADLQPTTFPMRMSVRGCPLYFQMTGPQQEKNNQGPIIRFGSHISGGDTVSRALRINNTSPYDIRLDWQTFNQERGDLKLLDLLISFGEPFPRKDVDGNEIIGGDLDSAECENPSWDWNKLPSTTDTNSSRNADSIIEEGNEKEDENEEPKQIKVVSVNLRPHDGINSDYPFCITPQQIVVPANGNATVHVSFTPLTLAEVNKVECVGYALGFMSLERKVCCVPEKVQRVQGYDLEPLRLDLNGSVKPSLLTAEIEDEEGAVMFFVAASDLIPKEPHTKILTESISTRNLKLKNSTTTPLFFRLLAPGPFSIAQMNPKGSMKTSQSEREEGKLLLLEPSHNMQVKVEFHNSLALLTYQNQPKDLLPPGVQLIQYENGERKLQFEQQLTVEYSNKSTQFIPLCAHLALPTLHISSQKIDFGICFVGQIKMLDVFLSNRGRSNSYWTAILEHSEKDGVFSISPINGTLEAIPTHISTSRETLQVSFTPRDSMEYKAFVTIHGKLGEQPLQLAITGTGSFDEKYEMYYTNLY
ncbi:deleted in lung and esophageal cancer protein 1 isoform X1 [Polypterus senegalus]|uniref:deleted in lung and esophageal cancer protein 1 isoform X1 n=1 Tax=Polypterus senegalus TaxID=55291 RepID=UPI0019651F43|nr:deleted in lung and esophageal cancer protein 1 isoform X1 [Polypterus senegalus]XP_039609640.1 deleted in lung and esophageal cancer protein 1 isoform X1 [Polypterus senegalus]